MGYLARIGLVLDLPLSLGVAADVFDLETP
jgi:hypothetical protein